MRACSSSMRFLRFAASSAKSENQLPFLVGMTGPYPPRALVIGSLAEARLPVDEAHEGFVL